MGILTFVIVLGILIFVHEFGHFYFAKRAGVGVEKFSIGFGPKLVAFTRGETEYRVGLIPLGGYVKMVGDNPDEAHSGSEKEFLSRPIRDRLPIVAAGPIVNLLTALLIMPFVYMLGVQVPAFVTQPAIVGYVVPDSPAAQARLQAGDQIVSINGERTADWEGVLANTMAEPGRRIDVAVARGGSKLTVPVVLGTDESGVATFGVQPAAPPVIGKVTPDSAAAVAGLKTGDVVTEINGTPIVHWAQMADMIQKNGARPMNLTYRRGAQTTAVTVTPQVEGDPKRAILGVQRDEPLVTQKYGVVASIGEGVRRVWMMTAQTFDVLGKLLTGKLSVKTLGGPIRIAQATSAAAASGLSDVLTLMAFLSLQLGIMNLLPFPILDGGHILFMGVEAVRRRPLSRKALEIANQVGFVLLVTLMLVVTKNDVMNAWGPNIRKIFDGVKHLF